jgi:glycine cleavage system regulatory protein
VNGHQTFKVGAHLLVPATISIDELRRELGTLANEMQVDIGLEERAPRAAA